MKLITLDQKGQAVGFFIGVMLAVIIALQVVWPVTDEVINTQTCLSVTNETFNVSGQEDTYIQLSYLPIQSGSESVYNSTDTYNTTDYNMNYTDGKIQPLSTGTMNFNISNGSTTYSIDYDHNCTTSIQNMSSSAQKLVNLIPLFLVLVLCMVFIRPLL